MIYHVAQADNDWPPREFLKSWGKPLAPRFRSIHTHQFAEAAELPLGTYLFSDLERQTLLQRQLQTQIWDQLNRHPSKVRLLNHPLRAMGRWELLKHLHDTGRNSFRALRFTERHEELRFPVFLRIETDHDGAKTPLIDSREILEDCLSRALLGGVRPEELLIVEFQETADPSGLYRKYSAFRVADRIIPRHLIFGRQWMLKYPDLLEPHLLDEERRFLNMNPHERELMEVFELASIDYGRIDYGLLDGRIQVWEINTNPVITLGVREYKQVHLPNQEWFAAEILAALQSIDLGDGEEKIPVRLDLSELP